jgi:HK97 family phage portal protein
MAGDTSTKKPRKKVTKKDKALAISVPVNPYQSPNQITKASATFQLFRDHWSAIDNLDTEPFDKMLNKFGTSTTWVYIAIKRIADAISQIPFQLTKESTGQVIHTYDKGIIGLLEAPNPFQRRVDFMETVIMCLELTGNAFIELVKDTRGRPIEMYVLNPSRVTIIPSKKDYIAGYAFSVNGRTIFFDREDIVHVKYTHPNNDYYGFSPLTAARVPIEVDKAANEWNHNFLLNGAWPVGALETENDIDDTEIKRIHRQLKSSVQRGKDQAGRLLVLTGGLKYNNLCISPKDADWLSGRHTSRDEILAIFGVPFAVAGLFSSEQTTARSAGVEQQIKQFYRTTIFPKMEKIIGALNRQVIPLFRQDVILIPNYRSVPALQEEVDQELTRAMALRALVGAGLSLNKALNRLYPDVEAEPWGDVAWMNQAMLPVSGPDAPIPPANPNMKPTVTDEESEKPKKPKDLLIEERGRLFKEIFGEEAEEWERIKIRMES